MAKKSSKKAPLSPPQQLLAQLEALMGGFSDSLMGRSPIHSKAGWAASCQAGLGLHGWPESGLGPFESVELGYPNRRREQLMAYAENPQKPCDTIYNRVPVPLVAWLLACDGGRAPDPEPWQARRGLRCVGQGVYGGLPGPEAPMLERVLAWMQAACLGSAQEEQAARFIADPAWEDALGLLARQDPSDPGLLAAGWAAQCERLVLDQQAPEPASAAGKVPRM